jgi:enoyl-CoA hydratase/carnithine racemase
VKEGPISYLVMNDKANNFDPERVLMFHKCLDKVEKDQESRLMITISTNPKFFSTGFNLNFFTKVKEAAVQLTVAMLKLYARILTMPVATMAVT